MKKKVYIIFLLVLWLLPSVLQGQEQRKFKRVSVNEGLSQCAVTCILQDHLGFMWFGTADGLNRFDGYEFKTFRHQAHNPNSLSDNYIQCLLEDKKHNMWIGTMGAGLTYYDRSNNRFTRFKFDLRDKNSLSSNNIYSVYEDEDTVLWIGTENGLNRFEPAKKTFRRYKPGGDFSYTIFSIAEDKKGNLWLGTNKGVHLFNKATGEFTHLQGMSGAEDETVVNHIYIDKKERWWFGTSDGLFNFNPGNKKFKSYFADGKQGSLESENVTRTYEDRTGNIWVGTTHGLHLLNESTGTFTSYLNNPYDPSTLSHNTILAIYEDESGVLWTGTFGGGINMSDRQHSQIMTVRHFPNANTISSPRIFSIVQEDNGVVWMGTEGGGLNKIENTGAAHLADKKFTHFKHAASDPNSLSSNLVWSLANTKGNTLWVGTIGGGLNKFNKSTGKAKAYFHDPADANSLSNNSVYSLCIDSIDSTLWIGTDYGLNRMRYGSNRFERFLIDSANTRSFSVNTVMSVYKDSRGNVWTGSFGGGLCLFDPREKKFTQKYITDHTNPGSISNNKIMCMYEDTRGRFWVGTFGGGLNLLNREEGTFTVFTQNDGLPNDVIYGILEDSEGNLWMSTNKGISRFNPDKLTFLNFDASDNLQGNEFNQGAYLKGKDGRLYFGGIYGYTAFYPERLTKNPYKPKVFATVYRKLNDPVMPEMLMADNNLVLPFSNNFITFHFTAFNYINPEKNEYAYKLAGLDDEWIYAGSRRFATYTNLSPGNYTFHVKASNNDGVWNEEGTTIMLTIEPEWWQTWWFRILVVLVLAAMLSALMLLFIRNVREKSRVQIAESELKASEAEKNFAKATLSSLRAQMNPHFIFNSLNSILHLISKNDSKSAREYLTKFSRMLRDILNHSRKERITLEEELETLNLYLQLEALRFDKKFTFEVIVDPGIDTEEEIPSMLIQPYVENAISHGLMNKPGGGHLKIELKKEDGNIICIVEDDGVGREKAAEIKRNKAVQYKSLGMKVNSDRLEMLHRNGSNGGVKIEDIYNEGCPAGTRVKIYIPVED